MTDTHDTTRGGTTAVTDALYRIERLEDRLHARDDSLADDISGLRRMVARRLMDDALDDTTRD